MKKQLTRTISFVIFTISIIALIIIVNQTIQLIQFMQSLHPVLGYVGAVGVLIVYGIIIVVPLVSFLKLPKVLHPPASKKSPEYSAYLQELGRRLSKNPELKKVNLKYRTRKDMEAGLKILDQKADTLIADTASIVFISTAISQNGRLDGILVLMTQIRLVWRLVHLYHQRPNWREVVNIYLNVFATALVVSSVEELDITEQVDPIITAVLGSGVAGAIPGTGAIVAIVTNSIVEGTANAYLTLRVGIICKNYSNCVVQRERGAVKQSANLEAAMMLGGIVREASKEVMKAMGSVAKRMGSGALATVQQGASEGASNLRKTATGVRSRIDRAFGRGGEQPEASN